MKSTFFCIKGGVKQHCGANPNNYAATMQVSDLCKKYFGKNWKYLVDNGKVLTSFTLKPFFSG